MLRPIALSLSLSLSVAAASAHAAARPQLRCDLPLLHADAQGQAIAGRKQAVLDAALSGRALRVGWVIDFGEHRVLHWAEAGFVTVWEDEVFTQIAPIHRQTPVANQARIDLPGTQQHWHGLLGTTGRLASRFSDQSETQDQQVETLWCLAAPPPPPACEAPRWRLLYRHDADGQALEGDKQRLFAAIRRGQPVRLAWGGAFGADGRITVEHSADPVFVSIHSGQEAYAQLAEHIAQKTYWEPGKAGFDDPAVLWRGVLGSDGSFDAAYVHRGTGETINHKPQRAGVSWYGFAGDPACETTPAPVLAVPGGVRAAQ